MTTDESFYYGHEGEVVRLRPSPNVAVDLAQVNVALADEVAGLVTEDQAVKGSIYLVSESDLDSEIGQELDDAGALHPAYLTDDATTIIVLPEVRVEASTVSTGSGVREAIESGELEAELAEDRGYRLKPRPASGRGQDALHLANQLHERIGPDTAQARFLRITPRPDTTR